MPLLDAAALGLGDVVLKSRLNEPLEVEIALIGANIDADGTSAAIGTEAMHGAAGIHSVALLRQLRVEVSARAEHGAYVRVFTRRAIREPIVSFLLVVENAREHVTREYTLLLDPPGYSLPVIATPEPVLEPAPAFKVTVAASAAARTERDLEQIGPVTPGDTLSKLAMRLGKDPGVTWAQMTWALYRINPRAFVGGDINMLRSNVYLRVPAAQTALRWSHREALALIKGTPAQSVAAAVPDREPLTQSPSSPVVASASANEPADEPAVPSVPPEDESPAAALEPAADSGSESPQAMFRLLSSDSVGDSLTNGSVGVPMTTVERERVNQLLAQANHQIQESHEEIARAREQLDDTTRQISTLVETVAEKDSQIRGLENRLAYLRERARQESIAMVRAEPEWMNRLLLEALLLAAMVGVLAVTLSRWADARRHRRVSSDVGKIALEFPTLVNSPTQTPPMVVGNDDDARLPEEEPLDETPVNEGQSIEHIELGALAEQGGPLMEANAYFAYGYHEKAKEVLTEFIKEHPAHAESRLVMLRVLHAIREKRKFKRHAEALLELVGDDFDERWIEAARLGHALFPEARLFKTEAHKRAEDGIWEKTVWTGTRPDLDDGNDHVYLDINEFKYVDLFLLDKANDADDAEDNGPPDSSSSASAEAGDTEAELAKWRADLVGSSEDRGLEHDLGDPGDAAENSTDDEQA
jgi:pilus assembly protein FimV